MSAVEYIKVIDNKGQASLCFVMGKSYLEPHHTTIRIVGSRFSGEVVESVFTHLGLSPYLCFYNTDSKVVLGYISNTSRRFYTYVSNRVAKILNF